MSAKPKKTRVRSCLLMLLIVLIASGGLGLRHPETALSATNTGASSGAAIQVLEVTPTSLLVEVIVPSYQIEDKLQDGESCQSISIPGYSNSGPTGAPALPLLGKLIGIPTDGAVSLQVLAAESLAIEGAYRICPDSQPAVKVDMQGEIISLDQDTAFNEQIYRTDAFLPTELVSIGDAGYLRSQRVAALRFQPFQYNPARSELLYYPRIQVRVDFPSVTPTTPMSDPVDEGLFEQTLRGSLLNYDQALAWRSVTTSGFHEAMMPDAALPQYKISVEQDGIFKVGYADLQAAGANVSGIVPGTLALSFMGNPVPIFVAGEGDGVFDPVDYLLFYGQRNKSKYSNTSVYWLTWGGANGLRMATENGAPGGAATVPSQFQTTAHLEQDKIYQSARPSGTLNDHWYWEGLQVTNANVTKDYYVTLQNISTQPNNAVVRGLFRSFAASPNHLSRIYLNGNKIDEKTWSVNAEYAFAVTVPHSYLVEGQNKITVEAVYGSGVSSQTFFVNWLEVDYFDTYKAESDLLYFDVDSSGTWEYRLDGFTTNTIDAFDITDPLQPRRILNGVVSSSGGGYQLKFTRPASNERHYLALTPGSWKPALSILPDSGDTLRSTQNQADYIIITHANFKTDAQRLADFRIQKGYRTFIADVQDVYDSFSGGMVDPNAVHDFLAYTYTNWKKPAPAYVVLMGDGHYDYKNNLGYNTPIYLPPYLADVDPYLGETATDNRFVTVSGSDILPDMYVGRLPANSPADAAAMVDKIIAYESYAPVDGWNTKALFVADNPDTAGNFHNLSDTIYNAYLPPSYTGDKVYLGGNYATATEARNAIVNAINQGRLLVSFIGHAAPNWWTHEKIFQNSDLSSLTNADRLAFMLPMTCQEGYFINPNSTSQSLGENIMRAANKGAIASFSPTGLGVASGHDILETGLFLALFKLNYFWAGAASTEAKYYLFANSIGYHDLIDTYVVFGDPATRLHTLAADQPPIIYLTMVKRQAP